jgi:integrase
MIRYYMDEPTIPEMSRLWAALDEHMYEPEWRESVFAFRLMLCTGTRLWETTQIAVADCHGKYIHIRFGKGEGKIRGQYKERYADIHPLIFGAYYREYLGSLPVNQRWLFPAHRKWFYPIGSRAKKRLNPGTISVRYLRNKWMEFTKLIGLRYLPPHEAFRKTFATWFAEELSRSDLQDQLGHRDYRTTDKIYRGSIPGRKWDKYEPAWKRLARESAARLDERISRKLHVV